MLNGSGNENSKFATKKWYVIDVYKGKLVKMIRNVGSKYDDYLISPKIRQILLHWSYELTEKDFLMS